MTTDKIIVTLLSILGVFLTFRFFLAKKERAVAVSDSIDIVVKGGYVPEVISVPQGKKTKLNFIRQDDNSCLEEIVLGDFKIRKHLPLNQKVEIEINPERMGEFTYSCGMGMYHGKIIVRAATDKQ